MRGKGSAAASVGSVTPAVSERTMTGGVLPEEVPRSCSPRAPVPTASLASFEVA